MPERRQVDEARPGPAPQEHRVHVLAGQLHGRSEAAPAGQASALGPAPSFLQTKEKRMTKIPALCQQRVDIEVTDVIFLFGC